APQGAQQVTQAPRQAPPPDEPIMVSSVEYQGARPMPVYPMASKRLREEGRVVVLVEISTQGLVDRASIDTSSGFSRLDESALAAARKARFKPLTRNGVAYPAKAKLPFDFVMRN
ncbi:energy transducer TonB, partial [Bordetella pertussis]